MGLPQPQNPEQAEKREKAAGKNPGPAPDKAYTLPTTAQTVTLTNTASAPGGEKGEQKTPDGKIESGPMDGKVRADLEKTFGIPLDKVVVHKGPGVDAQCAKRGAIAFAKGQEISISSKAGEPGTKGYIEVLGHEVAHVVQATGGSAKAEEDQKKKEEEKGGKKSAAGAGKETKAEDVKKDAGADSKEATKGKAAGGGKGGKEAEAKDAGKSAAAGQKAAPIEQEASESETQNAEPAGEQKNPNTFKIPIGGDRSIEFVPPNKAGDWSLGVGDVAKIYKGASKKGDKWWRKSIPTPFFGICAEVGAFIGYEAKLGEVNLKGIRVNYKKATNTYELEGEVGTGVSLEVNGGISAGVSADIWIASAGVGLKAKLALSMARTLSAAFKAGYSPTTGNFSFEGKLSLAALELEAKAAISLYAYYDACFVSTYCKEWTLWERTLGKLSFGGIDAVVGKEPGKGWSGKIEPKPPEVQDFAGNIKSMFPSKS